MDKETRERKIQEFIEWRKDKTEEEIGLYKNINPENLPDSFFLMKQKIFQILKKLYIIKHENLLQN